jgi:hypothetical protein
MIRKWLILPTSLAQGSKLILWSGTTVLLSAGAFVADYLGVARTWTIGAIVLLIVPITAGLASWLSPGQKREQLAKRAGA